MGVLVFIPYMDMPADCNECDADFAHTIKCNHWIEGTYQGEGRPKLCPLAEIPDIPEQVTVKRKDIE